MLQSDGMAGSRFQATVVQQSIEETLTSILSPKRRVDILRDIIASKKQRRPYVIVFCGVNGESLLVKCGRLLGETPPPPRAWSACTSLLLTISLAITNDYHARILVRPKSP